MTTVWWMGSKSVTFLVKVKEALEDPTRILLEV